MSFWENAVASADGMTEDDFEQAASRPLTQPDYDPRAEQHRTRRRFRRPASKQPIWHEPSARHSAGTGSHRPGL